MADDKNPSPATDQTTDVISRLQADMKAAMKAGDRDRLGVIRMLLSEARSADLQKSPTTPQEMVEAYHKRLTKGREEYEKIGDAAQLETLDAELAVVSQYVPQKASTEETHVLVDDFLAAHPDLGPRDIGKATGLFMRDHGKAVDAKTANARIREVLSNR